MRLETQDWLGIFALPVIRHSVELAKILWGASIGIVSEDLKPVFPSIAASGLNEFFERFLSFPQTRELAQKFWRPLLKAEPDWLGSRWLELTDGLRQLVAPGFAPGWGNFLLLVPAVHFKEAEEKDTDDFFRLAGKIKFARKAKSLYEQIPLLDQSDRVKLQTHLSVLTRELETILRKGSGRRHEELTALTSLRQHWSDFLGQSQAMLRIRRDIFELADEAGPVLIEGEPGTGKRTVARLLHNESRRRAYPLVELDCSATPAVDQRNLLLGSGWAPGERLRIDELACGGSLLLHEFYLLEPYLQAVLLSYFESQELSGQWVSRPILLTSRPIQALKTSGLVRNDFLDFVCGRTLYLPPLRARSSDIPILAQHFLARMAVSDTAIPPKFDEDVLKLLCSYNWPGNLWELSGVVKKLAYASRGAKSISLTALPEYLRLGRTVLASQDSKSTFLSLPEAVEQLERRMIMDALRKTRWNKTQAAKLLGTSRRNLIRKIIRYQLDRRKQKK